MTTEAYIGLNEPTTTGGKKLKTFETVDSHGNVVQIQVLSIVTPEGDEMYPAKESTLEDVLAAIRAQSAGAFSGPFVGTNGDSVPLVAAMPVAQPTTTLVRASAGAGATLAAALGLVVVGAGLTLPVRALADGVLTLPAATWDAVTGDVGGLVPGARYYLGVAQGQLSTSPPTSPGQYVTVIGSAITDVTLLVHPEPPILL